MNWKFALFLSLTLTLALAGRLSAGVINEEGFDFRQTKWGMTLEEVRAAEAGSKLVSQSQPFPWYDVLLYETDLKGQTYELKYMFMDGRLSRGSYTKSHLRHSDRDEGTMALLARRLNISAR